MGRKPVVVSQRTGQMIEAALNRDLHGLEAAYQLRGRENGARTFRWVPALWLKSMMFVKIFVTVWAVGVVLHLPILWGIGVLGMALFCVLHWHVLRNRRLTMIVSAVFVGMLAAGMLTNAFCSPWLCP
jgi:Flp pilus assembly protein TadB